MLERTFSRRACWAWSLLAITSCVFPADEPTGLELSWRFVEVNDIDGEEASRIRTCEGAGFVSVEFEITDTDNPNRNGTFVFDCETGFQTAEQFQTRSSDAFVPLDPGGYDVQVRGVFEGGAREMLLDDSTDVLSRTLTVEMLELARETVQWGFVLSGAQACEMVSASLLYQDPQGALADTAAQPQQTEESGETDGGDSADPVVYREGLRTDRGLPLSGAAVPCGDDVAGPHAVKGIDPGAYQLEVIADGTRCVVSVTVDADAPEAVIDLANESCGG